MRDGWTDPRQEHVDEDPGPDEKCIEQVKAAELDDQLAVVNDREKSEQTELF